MRSKAGKVNFCTGTGRKAFFEFFFGLILDPPRYICFYSEKRQIHLYRPFFPPLHGLFRKKGGTGTGIRFSFPSKDHAFCLQSKKPYKKGELRFCQIGPCLPPHTKGVMQQHATLRRVLRRLSNNKCFLEGFLESGMASVRLADLNGPKWTSSGQN